MQSKALLDILQKTRAGGTLSQEEAVTLLSLRDPQSIGQVMETARDIRQRYFGDKVFLYGFIYLSTYCRNQCTFCFYRKTNARSPRYRKELTEIVDIAARLVDSGVHLVDLTLGEDPLMHETGDFSALFHMALKVKAKSGIPLMVSPGVLPPHALATLAEIGVEWYALYQETHDPSLFSRLRVGQSFKRRVAARRCAHAAGMLVEDGFLLGVGESATSRADSILAMCAEVVQQVRVMSFVPQPQTPLALLPTPPRILECLCIAVMRLAMPHRLIPASLDVDGIEGLQMRLEAGANVVTSIIPPGSSLVGVAQSSLDVEQGRRTVAEVRKVLASLGLQPADPDDYVSWIAHNRPTSPSNVTPYRFSCMG